MQAGVDNRIRIYNEECPHSGRYCYGKTPMQTFLDARQLALDKMLESHHQPQETAAPLAA